MKQISEETLLHAPDLWISCCPELNSLANRQKDNISNAILGAHAAGLVTDGIGMLARFMILLDDKLQGRPIERALDEALPAFRIPRGAGHFKDFAAKGRVKTKEKWAEELGELHGRAEDALYLRNDRGQPLSRNVIRQRLADLVERASITQADADIFTALLDDEGIEAGRWRASQENVSANLKWDDVEIILKATKQTKKASLGDETIAFFERTLPRQLSGSEKNMLTALTSEDIEAKETERDFFFTHREAIKDDRKLLKRWETLVFKENKVYGDLLTGIVHAVANLVDSIDELPADARVAIKLEGGDRLNFWKSKNASLYYYLRDRFRGLPNLLLRAGVICDFGMCWSHPIEFSGNEKNSQSARQFKFDVALVTADALDEKNLLQISDKTLKEASHSSQFIWMMPTNSFANAHSLNWRVVGNMDQPEAALLQGAFSRARRTERVADGLIDLENRASIQDILDNPDGLLVDINIPSLNLGTAIRKGIDELEGTILRPMEAKAIRDSFEAFAASYTKAVRAFLDGNGLGETAILDQSALYGEFLSLLRKLARKDDCRTKLWTPALSIGIAKSTDKPCVAISCPWHPLRLAEAKVKAERMVDVLAKIVSGATNGSSLRIFASEATEQVDQGWHPTMTLVPDNPRPRMLIETEHFADFGLMEPPTLNEGAEEAFDGYSKEAAAAFLDIAQRYLDLNPHERANFSVVLYNADNRDLPSRLADQLARKIENESDLRCDLILTHTDQQRLRRIYAEQNVTISQELDGVLASEATQSFLSRLRVGFLDVGTVGRGPASGRMADIVFLHDVIARSAHTGWRKCEPPQGGWPTFAEHDPNAETRRQFHEAGSRKTEVLLVPAERPIEVQAYIDLIHDLHTDDRDDGSLHYVPIREVNFDDTTVSKAIDEAHKVATWVVTFDGIADLQLLRSNDISVIHFVTRPGSSHNIIVSTKQTSKTLRQRLVEQIDLIRGGAPGDLSAIADFCIREAALISGMVVLRAARLEKNALELLGLVMSRQVITDSLPQGIAPVAWLLLDDFGKSIGHARGKMSDLLAVCLGTDSGRPVIDLVVVESKFVGSDGQAQEAALSLAQTKASTNDIRDRIVLDGDHLNKHTWRSRLADLMLEHGVFEGEVASISPRTWAKMLREDEVNIRIQGASLVFIHDCIGEKPPALPSESDDQRQYIFDRAEIARVLERSLNREGAAPLTLDLPVPMASRLDDTESEAEGITGFKPEPHENDGTEKGGKPSLHPPEEMEGAEENKPSKPETVAGQASGSYPPSVTEFISSYNGSGEDGETLKWLEKTKTSLRIALRGYGLDADIVGERLTPNSALIRFKGSSKMTVAEVERRKEVLLTSHELDVMDVRPSKGEVIIMVARPKRATILLPQLWRRRGLPDTAPISNGSFLIGEKEQDGELFFLNLFGEFGGQPQHGPHTLIAGETGGGKGVLTRNILLDLLATNSPRNARVRFVDPKFGADYPWITGMPHLDGGLVTSQEEAIKTLEELVAEMDRRYEEITKVAPNIDKYNAKVAPDSRLPRIYLFHDEIGDWMADKDNSDYRDAVASHVVRLASKARAAGVHLFLITQRPDRDALPSQVKANMNNKICLKVASGTNSRIVLDENGAENLLGQGHFAAKLANERVSSQTSLVFGQAPFMDDDEAWELAAAIKAHWQ
ncbi:FtsK/SpoIIIE domain-containing protein [Microvirga ossetica]|uniref:FtsK/SpoIIIE domain-containing protein n=1 Tax=Microvirga ossetica TaxID=1882682 RepID=UPI0013000A19|nr:FtsK/SpoIIIE domain-containing protein [Microvirga ossetica]